MIWTFSSECPKFLNFYPSKIAEMFFFCLSETSITRGERTASQRHFRSIAAASKPFLIITSDQSTNTIMFSSQNYAKKQKKQKQTIMGLTVVK